MRFCSPKRQRKLHEVGFNKRLSNLRIPRRLAIIITVERRNEMIADTELSLVILTIGNYSLDIYAIIPLRLSF